MASTTVTKCSNIINSHEDSFSSYLNLIRENLAHDLGGNSSSSSPTPSTMRVSIGKRRSQNGELDIFSAEKYFNGLMDDARSENSTGKNLCKNQARIISLKSRSCTDQSSCTSETSANSRSTLLRDCRKKLITSSGDLKKSNSKKFLGVFRCPCAGKDDIKADEEHHSRSPDHATEFLTERIVLGLKKEGVAIGAFGSPLIEKPVIGASRRKASSVLAPASGGAAGGDNDDLNSESSSDLFEIDSLNLSIHVHPLFNPEPAYEPSEASIEWSVATASGGNDDRRSETMKKATKNHKTGLLSGCANNKAVSVHAHSEVVFERPERVNSGHHDHHFGLQSLPPVARYHASQAIYTR